MNNSITLAEIRELFEKYKMHLVLLKYKSNPESQEYVEKFEAMLKILPEKYQKLAIKIFLEGFDHQRLCYSKSNFYSIIGKITNKFKKYAKLLFN